MAGKNIRRLLNKSARIITDIRYTAGLDKPSVSGKKIIMYHGIDSSGNKKFNLRFVGVKDFEEQIAFYKKYFNVISIKDYFEGRFDEAKVNIAITFDDGYANNFKYALPVLEKHKVPATFFITGLNQAGQKILWFDLIDIVSTYSDNNIEVNGDRYFKKGKIWYKENGNISLQDVIKERGSLEYTNKAILAIMKVSGDFRDKKEYFDYWKLMSDKEITDTSRSPFITIGSHGYMHNNLGIIPFNDAMDEIKRSKDYLEGLIGKPIESIGYPDSSYTRELIDSAHKIGFKYQLATESYRFPDDKDDPRIMNRIGIYPAYSTANIIKNLMQKIDPVI